VFVIVVMRVIVVMMRVIMVMMMLMLMPVMMLMSMLMMAMCVIVVLMMMVPMIMPMRVVIRLERRRDLDAGEAVLGHQRFDLRQLLHPHAVGEDLHRHVAIAEHIDEPRHRGEILGPHLDEGLYVGDDFGEPAIVEHQQVVGAQMWRLGKIELNAGALAAEHEAVLLAPVVEPEQQRVGDLGAGLALGENFLCARHALSPKSWKLEDGGQRRGGRSLPRSNGTTAGRSGEVTAPSTARSADLSSGLTTLPGGAVA
jgi:hypothetical protein